LLSLSVRDAGGAPLDQLASGAGTVVVGSISSRLDGPSQVSFTLNALRVRGGSPRGATVAVTHHWSGAVFKSNTTVAQRLTGLWFLTPSGTAGWDVLTANPDASGTIFSLFLLASRTSPAGAYAYTAGTALVDVLALEAAAGV
jgi:hypothetical protein